MCEYLCHTIPHNVILHVCPLNNTSAHVDCCPARIKNASIHGPYIGGYLQPSSGFGKRVNMMVGARNRNNVATKNKWRRKMIPRIRTPLTVTPKQNLTTVNPITEKHARSANCQCLIRLQRKLESVYIHAKRVTHGKMSNPRSGNRFCCGCRLLNTLARCSA